MHCVLRSVLTSVVVVIVFVVVVVFLTNISRKKVYILALVPDDLFLPRFLSLFFWVCYWIYSFLYTATVLSL